MTYYTASLFMEQKLRRSIDGWILYWSRGKFKVFSSYREGRLVSTANQTKVSDNIQQDVSVWKCAKTETWTRVLQSNGSVCGAAQGHAPLSHQSSVEWVHLSAASEAACEQTKWTPDPAAVMVSCSFWHLTEVQKGFRLRQEMNNVQT